MAISLLHEFQTAISDGSDTSLVQGTDWNDEHDLSMATSRILGRLTSGVGSVQELDSADAWDVLQYIAGTNCMFWQTSAPTGWTKQTVHNNKALRLVSGTASSGGTTAFTSVFTSRTISIANLPPHTHEFGAETEDVGELPLSFNRLNWLYDLSTDGATRDTNGAKTVVHNVDDHKDNISAVLDEHTHYIEGETEATGSGTAMDFAVQYVDVIIASRDA